MGKKIKILLIDDDENSRNTYAEVFRREGFEVVEAIDGLDGLDKATKENPDIIFTGIIMPRMDGFGLKDALAKNVSTSKIPVIMISHMGREEDRRKASELGINDFIVQGMITPREVVDKIKSMFSSGDYKINFHPGDLDGPRIAKKLNSDPLFKCAKCSERMVISLLPIEGSNGEFRAKFICPNCE